MKSPTLPPSSITGRKQQLLLMVVIACLLVMVILVVGASVMILQARAKERQQSIADTLGEVEDYAAERLGLGSMMTAHGTDGLGGRPSRKLVQGQVGPSLIMTPSFGMAEEGQEDSQTLGFGRSRSAELELAVGMRDPPFYLYRKPAKDRPILDTNDKVTSYVKENKIEILTAAEYLNKTTGISHEGLVWSMLRAHGPRLMYGHGTLDSKDCDALVTKVGDRLERSQVNGGTHGESTKSTSRTSQGIFLTAPGDMRHPANIKLRKRLAGLVGVPEDHIEATQILRYEGGQRYNPHMDTFKESNTVTLDRGGQRLASAITWLNDVTLPRRGDKDCSKTSVGCGSSERSGTTSFPNAVMTADEALKGGTLRISPRKGDTILFYNMNKDFTIDSASLHGGDPPEEGVVKYVAVLWFHPRAFN